MNSLLKYTKTSGKSNTNVLQTNEAERERALPKTFLEAKITLTPKPDKDSIKKENYIPIC